MTRKDKRFVIQKHTSQAGIHWDFMLEGQGILRTYRLDKSPEQLLQGPAEAEKIFDHPLKFLTYQGSVNKGQDGVCIVESGTYQAGKEGDNLIELHLTGQILKGNFILKRLEEKIWSFFAC